MAIKEVNMKSRYILTVPLSALFLSAHLPSMASETDDRIQSSFKQSYVFKTYLKDDSIQSKSVDGNVVMTGQVTQESHKDLAGETMNNLPGVKNVDNRIKIRDSLPAVNSDAWVRMKIESMLLFHRNVSVTKTKVSVNNGVVTLRGNADNQAQKDLTTEYAKDIHGVKSIRNEMNIVKPDPTVTDRAVDPIDDASITAQIKVSLVTHRSTHSLDTHVKTKDGVVTLTGKAKNPAEKALVSKLALDTKGVKNVVNEIALASRD
jgi:hyperosmotically inducible protein